MTVAAGNSIKTPDNEESLDKTMSIIYHENYRESQNTSDRIEIIKSTEFRNIKDLLNLDVKI